MKKTSEFDVLEPKYQFFGHNSRVFITGVPLSGKSSLSPLIVKNIDGCTWQNMDIIRLTAQMIEEQKPENLRSPFINYGSCDAYVAVGNGEYTQSSLIEGFLKYAEVVGSSLAYILPKLETQGAKDVLFEGVQLTPDIVKPFMNSNSRLVLVTSTEEKLVSNAKGLFGNESWLLDRYSPDKLLILQQELLTQARRFPSDKLIIVDNSGYLSDTAFEILTSFESSGLIIRR